MLNDEYCITSGEFQKMCQTTRDCLRHYAETGILVPYTNPENGYHYYSYAQVGSFYMIKVLREMDTPIANISAFLNNAENMGGQDFMGDQYKNLLKKRRELDEKIKATGNMIWFLELSRRMTGEEPVLLEIDGQISIKATAITGRKAYSIKDVPEDVKRHLNQFGENESAFPMGAVILKEDFRQEDYRYDKLFSPIKPKKTNKSGKTKLVGIAISSSPMYNVDIRARYKALEEFLKKNGLQAKSDIYVLSLVNITDPSGERRYLKCAAVIV